MNNNIDYKKLYLQQQKVLEAKKKQIEALRAKKISPKPTYKQQLLHRLKANVLQGVENVDTVIKDIEKVSDKHHAGLRISKARYKNRNGLEVIISRTMTKDQIKEIGQELSETLHEDGIRGSIETACIIAQAFWRSGSMTPIGQGINIYEAREYDREYDQMINDVDTVDATIFYVLISNGIHQGGKDANNDCFYHSLKQAMPDDVITKHFRTPATLKKYLKINRDAMISVEHIPLIENKIQTIGINISGDIIYTSPIQSNKAIYLKLINNHYSVNHRVNAKITISYTEKPILMHDKLNKIGYDGKNYIEMTPQFLIDVYHGKEIYNVVPKGRDNKLTLEEEFNDYIQLTEELIKETNGRVNLYKSGSIKRASLTLFDELTKHLTPDKIEQDEALWIQESTRGALIFSEQYEGNAYKWDVKSMYPSIMSSSHLVCPIKRGVFSHLTQEQFKTLEYYSIGIYSCIITPSKDTKIDRLFRFNQYNKYTQDSLNHAKELGLQIELIDTPVNVLLYPRSHCLKGSEIFKSYCDYLYPLKEKGIKGAKLLLNILSGIIGETDEKIFFVDESNEANDFIIPDNYSIIYHKPLLSIQKTKYYVANNDEYFKSNFGRIKPFLLGKSRLNMCKLMLPYNDKIIKCNTDSIISKEDIPYTTGVNMGDLKIEYANVKIRVRNNAKEELL